MRAQLRFTALAVLGFALAVPSGARAVNLPPNFVAEDVAPGAAFNTPVGIAFMPDGRLLVAEKRGRLYAVKNGVKNPTPMWSRENEVLNNNDRGLLGVAVDPRYFINHFIYLLYTVDPDSNGNDNNDDAFGRLVRYQVNFTDSNTVVDASRTVLIGASWRTGIISASGSHTVGALRFGHDGSLLVSAGDGAQFNAADQGGVDPGAFGATRTDPYEDIGAFRSLYIGSLAGKVLRIDPATGLGYPSNPYYDGNAASIRSRVWVYGLRNPYRFTVRPGTGSTDPAAGDPGTLYIGDVGWNTFEEADVAEHGGINFGWPCYEGIDPQATYQAATPSHGGCDSIGTFNDPTAVSSPVMAWHHSNDGLSTPPGFHGNTSIGGAFYTGTRYPVQYQNAYFFGDYGQNWIMAAKMDSNDQLVQLLPFADAADGPVDFAIDPDTGDLCYVAIATGQVRRIRFTGSLTNTPPVAVADGTPTAGAAPLSVTFSSVGTLDPDGDPITYAWNFGDGQGSTLPDPVHVYTSPGIFNAVLSVADTSDGIGRDTVRVIVTATAGFPTTAVLDNFNRANGPIGGLWVDATSGLVIDNNALTQTGGTASTIWNGGTFGSDQEAFITLAAVTPGSPEQNLMLKVQGLSWSTGNIEVRYDATASAIYVSTYDPISGWQAHGTIAPVTLQAGDQLGARAFGNGAVEVFRNGVQIGEASVAGWPYSGAGGHLGFTCTGATSSRFDNFGGGDVVLDSNTPPTAGITTPLDHSFYTVGDTIWLTGTASDAEDPPASLAQSWEMDIHHNTHVHPNSFVSDSASTYFIGENHDDGTGIWLLIRHIVTDTGGLSDTAIVQIYPEVDLAPSPVTTAPSTPGTTAPATYTFRLRNLGRMPAPISRWRLVADQVMLAEGDTLVSALDSVTVTRTLPPVLGAGVHTLRVVADTLGTVVETDESDNAETRALTVVSGDGPDERPPGFLAGPIPLPAGVTASVLWKNDEPTTGVVRYGPTPAFGDSATAPLDTTHTATLDGLTLGAKYFYQVVVRDTASNPAAAPIDSFLTPSSPLGADDPPLRFALSGARPNPSSGGVAFTLELPVESSVAFDVLDVQGRRVWREPERRIGAGVWTLGWNRAGPAGPGPGLYFARISVNGQPHVKRFAIVR